MFGRALTNRKCYISLSVTALRRHFLHRFCRQKLTTEIIVLVIEDESHHRIFLIMRDGELGFILQCARVRRSEHVNNCLLWCHDN